jgi:rhodanese-related sulfurtransferase
MKITPVSELVARASEQVTTLAAQEAMERKAAGDAVLVDLRDIRELDREGRIEGALHVPRGMLEFWFDPSSPYHKQSLAEPGKTYVLFCAAGWRSALSAKTLEDMGFRNVAHVDGGFAALKAAGAPIASKKE